jgi:hypothetical protein
MQLQEYDLTVTHRSGADNFFADALSQNPTGLSNEKHDILKGPNTAEGIKQLRTASIERSCLIYYLGRTGK